MNINCYQIKKLEPGIIAITEGSVHMYLVLGSEKSLLIDTGYGQGDLQQLVAHWTDKPLIVVNTHGHIDHVGGNLQFEKIYANRADWDIAMGFSGETEEHLIPLKEKDIINLGDKCLDVIELPGHSPGSLGFWDKKNRVLFSGDYVSDRTIYLCFEHCSLEKYICSLERIISMESDVDVLFGGHGIISQDMRCARKLLLCAKAVAAGRLQGVPTKIFDGTIHPMYTFDTVSIFGQ